MRARRSLGAGRMGPGHTSAGSISAERGSWPANGLSEAGVRSDPPLSRSKRAELTSGVGAILLGLGLGVILARYLEPYGPALLILGLLMHVWGMFSKHQLERNSGSRPVWWSEALYWTCWVTLVGLAGYVTVRMAGG